jgi:hypothetical protein
MGFPEFRIRSEMKEKSAEESKEDKSSMLHGKAVVKISELTSQLSSERQKGFCVICIDKKVCTSPNRNSGY